MSVATSDTINPALGPVTALTAREVLQAVAEIEQERARSQQVVRQTNGYITQRLAAEIGRSVLLGLDSRNNQLAASADQDLLDVFWGNANYSHLGNDKGNPLAYSTDMYQFVGGVDKTLGDFVVGTSLTYVYSNTQQVINDNNTHTIGVTPYAAYKFNDYVFATLLAGYNYTNTDNEARGRNSDTHDYLTEFNINGVYAIDSFFMKGRGGVRYKHTYTSIRDSMDADFDELVWIGDVEFGYQFDENISAYTGALYEYRDQESFNLSNVRIGGNEVHDGVVYIRAGVDYQLTSGFFLGVSGTTEVNDEDHDIYTVGLNFRLDI
ncbi:MAG: hypothetical protein RQ715_01955 [Methylococcales bacterium]|nr:hypothetical protein [Methylococcales bacterium]